MMEILIQFDSQLGSLPLRDRMKVFVDGGALLHAASPLHGKEKAQVGAFWQRLSREELAAVSEGAASLSALDGSSVLPQRGPFQIWATAGGRSFPLLAEAPVPAFIADAARLYDELRQKMENHPLAAIRLEARMKQQGGENRLLLVFENPGTEAVTFQLDPRSILLRRPAGPDMALLWQNAVRPRTGILARDGDLLDGFLLPAEIPAGEDGALLLPIAVEGTALAGTLEVEAGGKLCMAAPGAPAADFPDTPFLLSKRFDAP